MNTSSLRTVICPLEIVSNFLRLSQINTSAKIETCAILAGIEQDNKLVITTLILPPQTGQQDQCSMTDEGEIQLFEAQIANEVMTLGWIHTHPQFVSSPSLICLGLVPEFSRSPQLVWVSNAT